MAEESVGVFDGAPSPGTMRVAHRDRAFHDLIPGEGAGQSSGEAVGELTSATDFIEISLGAQIIFV